MRPLRGRQVPPAHEVERRLASLEDALAESWIEPAGLAVVADQLARLLPGTAGLVYFREPDGGFGPMGHVVNGRLETSWDTLPRPKTDDALVQTLRYPLLGPYEHEGQFINTRTSFGGDRERLDQYQEDTLGRNGARHHLRVAFYVEGRMRGWYGLLGDRADHEFTREEAALVSRALPSLRDAVRSGHLTRYGRARPEVLQAILEAFDRPAWILTSRGFVVHANALARSLGRDARAGAARAMASREGDPRFAISRVAIEEEPLTLVVGRTVVGHSVVGRTASAPELPPSLARIAERISSGLSDKDIANELEIPLSTVRTYVQRIYTKLGVHNRVELAMRWRARAR